MLPYGTFTIGNLTSRFEFDFYRHVFSLKTSNDRALLIYFFLKNKKSDNSNFKKKKNQFFYNKNKFHHQVGTHMKNESSQLYFLDLKYNTITKSTNVVSFYIFDHKRFKVQWNK